MLTVLDHVVIAVADLDAATDAYSRLFGLSPSWCGTHGAFGTANTLFRLQNTYIELLAADGEGPVADFVRARLAERGEGPLALAFGTADAASGAIALRARGIDCADPAPGSGTDRTTGVERKWLSFALPQASSRGVPLIVIQHQTQPEALPVAEVRARGDARAAVAGVDHVVIMTSDADAAIALYRDAFGIRLALDRTFRERALRLLFFRLGGITIECAVPQSARPVDGAPVPSKNADQFWGVCYRVADVSAARERLLADGFDVSEVRTGMKPGTRVCTVRDQTHGVATLLIGPADA